MKALQGIYLFYLFIYFRFMLCITSNQKQKMVRHKALQSRC